MIVLKKRWMMLALALVWMVADTQAGIMYSVRENDDTLVFIDTDTLDVTEVGALGMSTQFGDLAWDSRSETMYLVDGWGGRMGLWTVDLDSGQATLVDLHGFDSMFGLAYDPTTDTLYGSQSTRDNGFFEIDKNTGEATLLGNPGINLDGLAYDSERDQLIGAWAGPGSLHDIDRSDGSQTTIFDGDFFNNCGMTYDPDKDLFWLIDWSGNLYSYDPNDGYARTLRKSGLGAHDGLAYITAGGGRCNYTIKKSKSKRGCDSCPEKNDLFETETRCETVKDCKKRIKTTIACPEGNGLCKIKGKRQVCD